MNPYCSKIEPYRCDPSTETAGDCESDTKMTDDISDIRLKMDCKKIKISQMIDEKLFVSKDQVNSFGEQSFS